MTTIKTASTYYRLAIGMALATVLFLIYGIGALGIIGAGGMAQTLLGMALAQALVAVIALIAGLQHTEGASVLEILSLNGMYAALFGLSAWLFGRAAEQHSAVPVSGRA